MHTRNANARARVDERIMQQSTFDIPESEVAQIRAEIRAQLDEMKRLNERTKENQREIERLKIETRATLANLAKMVAI